MRSDTVLSLVFFFVFFCLVVPHVAVGGPVDFTSYPSNREVQGRSTCGYEHECL